MQDFRGKNIILEKFKVVFIKLQGLKHNSNKIEGLFSKSIGFWGFLRFLYLFY
jgi:hypothetical protein